MAARVWAAVRRFERRESAWQRGHVALHCAFGRCATRDREGGRPMHIPDLRTDTLQFPEAAPVPFRPIGWLSDKHPFPTGKVDRAVVRRLELFRAASHSGWQPYLSLGSHTCELCDDDARSHTHLFIPSEGL